MNIKSKPLFKKFDFLFNSIQFNYDLYNENNQNKDMKKLKKTEKSCKKDEL